MNALDGKYSENSALLPKYRTKKGFLIPQRYVVGIMGFLAVLNAYTMRISLSVAINAMVIPHEPGPVSEDTCSYKDEDDEPLLNAGDRFDWDKTTQGLILSSFYYGYVLTHMPGGILAEKFGGKYSLGLGILSTAIFTLLTPVVAQTGNAVYLCLLRVCVGLGEGTTFPALNAILAKWVPIHERSRIGSLTFAGSLLGTVLGNAVSGALIQATLSWASPFYLFGGLGILWFIIWVLICYSDPDSHPFISDEEKAYLAKELANVSKSKKVIPWKAILTSIPLWALIAAQIGHDWGFFSMVTDLPIYMNDILKFNVTKNGIWSSVPYILMWFVSIGSGWLCDWLIKKNYMGITFARKFFTTVASIGPGIFMLAASYAGCDRVLTILLFTIAMGLMGTFYCGMKVNALDLSPNFAGTLMALVNGIGAISGIITPYLISALTADHKLSQWRLVFWITLGVLAVTNIIYIAFASGDEQWWNAVEPSEPKEEEKEKPEKYKY